MRKNLIEIEKYFLNRRVKVRSCDGTEYEGILKGYYRSRHKGIGSLVLEKDGIDYIVRRWKVILLEDY